MAEFDNSEDLLEAAQRAHAEGYRRMDAYCPFPVEGLAEATGLPPHPAAAGRAARRHCRRRSADICCSTTPRSLTTRSTSAVVRCTVGRHSFPVTFEMTILVAALAAVLGMLALNRLPMPYHPVFNVPRFEHGVA